jgi:hypothetical protein
MVLNLPKHWHCPWCDRLGDVTLEEYKCSSLETDWSSKLKKRAIFRCPNLSDCIGQVSALGTDEENALKHLHARLRDATS